MILGGPVPGPPVATNDTEAIMAYVNHQLDSIGKKTEILSGLRLLGGGRNDRLQGGELLHSLSRCWGPQHATPAIETLYYKSIPRSPIHCIAKHAIVLLWELHW